MISENFQLPDVNGNFDRAEGPRFAIVENLFEDSLIRECSSEFLSIPPDDFIKYQNPLFEFGKSTLNDVGKMPKGLHKLFSFIHSQEFIDIVGKITGMKDLLVDDKRWGGGLHKTDKGGYLAVHKDFNILPTSYTDEDQMLRCINLIGYLNPNWQEGEGGDLEFWDSSGKKPVVKIPPKFNTWVLFDTRDNYHGHPYPYQGGTPRISIASYYYQRCKVVEEKWMSTEYLKLPWMEDSEEYKKARQERADHKLRYSALLKR